jgi:NAD(P)-dependent dehydrogenase (short-subunit alcohol dehydrogenase family)
MATTRTIVVTGAGTGIGRAIALRLAAEGAALGLLARDVGRLQDTAAAAREAGAADVVVLGADVRDGAVVEEALGRFTAALGPLNALVANAGVGGPNAPGPDDRWAEIVETNLTGTYHCLRAALPRLAPAPAPRRLVVTSSILARIGVPGYTAYCASKAGLLGLVRSLAVELAPQGVLVNAVCPGWVDTEMSRDGIQAMAHGMGTSYEGALAEAMSHVPLGRMSTPEEIAGVVSWLLGPDAATVTGQGLDVNGGAWLG